MKIYEEFNINTFVAWSGAIETQNRIIDEGKADLFNTIIEDIFADGCTSTEMNDFLRFDYDYIFDFLGINEEDKE